MFAVRLLDALAEAAVLLMFDITPTRVDGAEDDDVHRATSVASWSSFESCVPRSHVTTTRMDGSGGVVTPPTASSVDDSSFVQLSAEDLQSTPRDAVDVGRCSSRQPPPRRHEA